MPEPSTPTTQTARTRRRLPLAGGAAALAVVALLSASGGAVAGSLVTSADIKNGTIKGADVAGPALDSFQRVNGYVQVTDEGPIGTDADGDLSATCPEGKQPLSVSGYLSGGNEGVQTSVGPSGGVVFAHNDGPAASLYIVLVCATT